MSELTRKDEMEKAILAENEEKFHQTEDWCPLLHGQLALDLGLMGDGPRVPDVLHGTYECPDGTSEHTRKWIEHMKIEDIEEREKIITNLTDYRNGWKKTNERTASGELHMGHFKAGSLHTEIGWFHFAMTTIPVTTGYSPSRWRKGTDVMLLKSPEIYLLKKLRTIVLYEADYNHENKRIGRDSMNMALQQGQIVHEQYSRPGRSAQDNALNKRLVFDHFRFRKEPFGMCACDLKSCYDRIVHSAASIALQRIGISLPRIQCMFSTVQRLVHHVRTAFGQSEGTFGGDNHNFELPPQGTGQGNGAAPAIWSILSSTIFQLLHKDNYSTPFRYAISAGLFRLCGFSYVDDCDLIRAGPRITEVAKGLQDILTAWDRYMQVTGAAIAPDKCWWYLADFKWTRGQWKYRNAGDLIDLKTRDKDGEVHSLTNLSYDKAKEMVGVFLAPDGNQKEQASELLLKAQKWSAYVKSGRLDHESTWTALRTTIVKSIEYPLAATSLTQQECISIMDPVLKAALPRANIVQNFARAVLYGPVQYQGMGLHDPYISQGIRHIKDIVDQQWKKTMSGNIITTSIEAAQLEAGLYGPLFHHQIQIDWFNTTNTWIVHTLEFCQNNGIRIERTGPTLSSNCQYDTSLMEVFLQYGCTKAQMKALNRCRLEHQVVSVSDLVTGDGRRLIVRGTRGKKNRYAWPAQGKVLSTDWTLWDQILQLVLCGIGTTLIRPLGLWTLDDDEYFNGWEWFLGADDNLYRCQADGWEQVPRDTSGRSRQHRYIHDNDSAIYTFPPTEISRTTVIPMGRFLTHTGTRGRAPPPRNTHLRDNIMQDLREDPETSWITETIQLPSDMDKFISQLYKGHMTGVSDGSYVDTEGLSTAGWILSTPEELEMEGSGLIPGTVLDHSAYRGELGGVLAQILVLSKIEARHPGPKTYNITIACDGESALYKSLTTHRSKLSSTDKAFDILTRVADIRGTLRARLNPVHVDGHVDDTGRALTFIEKLNCRMDGLAKRTMARALDQQLVRLQTLPPSKFGMSSVSVRGVEINTELLRSLRFHVGKHRILMWWLKKERFNRGTLPDIHWSVTHGVMNEASFKMAKFMAKWVTGQFGVGIVMEYRKARADNGCPRCFEQIEDPLHVLQCPHETASTEWDKLLNTLQEWMRNVDTHPALRAGISQVLWNYRAGNNTETFIPPDLDTEVQQCFVRQSRLGWTQFLHGFLSHSWAETQGKYYKARGSRREGRRWAVNLSKQLWWIVFGMWDHRNQEMFSGKADVLGGQDLLKQAIQRELQRGIDTLSPVYTPYFRTTTRSLFKKPIEKMKQWLVVVRRGRMALQETYTDNIARSLEVQHWIGLITQEEVNRQRRLGRHTLEDDETGNT